LNDSIVRLTNSINNEIGRDSSSENGDIFGENKGGASDADIIREAEIAGREEAGKSPNIIKEGEEKAVGFFGSLEVAGSKFKTALQALAEGDLPTFGKELLGSLGSLLGGLGNSLSGIFSNTEGSSVTSGISKVFSSIFGAKGKGTITDEPVSNNKAKGLLTKIGTEVISQSSNEKLPASVILNNSIIKLTQSIDDLNFGGGKPESIESIGEDTFFGDLKESGIQFKDSLIALANGDIPKFGSDLFGSIQGIFGTIGNLFTGGGKGGGGLGGIISGLFGGGGKSGGGLGGIISGLFGGGGGIGGAIGGVISSLFRKGVSNFGSNKFAKGTSRFGRVTPNSRSSFDNVEGLSFDGNNVGKVLLGPGESVITSRATEFLGDDFINSVNSGINPMPINTQGATPSETIVNVPQPQAPMIINNNLITEESIEQAILTDAGRTAVTEIINEVKTEE
jgi:hypothetical protein